MQVLSFLLPPIPFSLSSLLLTFLLPSLASSLPFLHFLGLIILFAGDVAGAESGLVAGTTGAGAGEEVGNEAEVDGGKGGKGAPKREEASWM